MIDAKILGLVALLALAACSKAPQESADSVGKSGATAVSERKIPEGSVDTSAVQASPADSTPLAELAAAQEAEGNRTTTALPGVGTGPLRAYSYYVAIEAAAKDVPTLSKRHEVACEQAGPDRCQVVLANANVDLNGVVNAELSLRADPRWLTPFRQTLARDAEAVSGRLVEQNTTSEDLTRQIIDVGAQLSAKKALRERLEGLLRDRPGKLADLLEVERELARVQSEIDAQESELAVMRTRVSLSELDLVYRSRLDPVGHGALSPIISAWNDAARIMADALGGLIRLAAFLLPFIILGLAFFWLGRALWRARKTGAKPAPTPPTA